MQSDPPSQVLPSISESGNIQSSLKPAIDFKTATNKTLEDDISETQILHDKFILGMLLMQAELLGNHNKGPSTPKNIALGRQLAEIGIPLEADNIDNLRYRLLSYSYAGLASSHEFSSPKYNRELAFKVIQDGAHLLGDELPFSPNNRQSRVIRILDDATQSANIPKSLLIGIWGFESNWGNKLKSPTGCMGDFQFSRSTLVEVINKNGAVIHSRLTDIGMADQANLVRSVYDKTRNMNGKEIIHYASRNKDTVDALRMSPEVSTYAAALYLEDIAKRLKVDPNDSKNYGLIYAGFNIGVGHARTLKNGGIAKGWEVEANRNLASGANPLSNYQASLSEKIDSGEGQEISKISDRFNLSTARKDEHTSTNLEQISSTRRVEIPYKKLGTQIAPPL